MQADHLASAVLAAIRGADATTNMGDIGDLASCIGRGNGACGLDNGVSYLVLRDLRLAEAGGRQHPTIVACQVRETPRLNTLLTTREVARFFRQASAGLGEARPEGYRATWAPAATRSLAKVVIGGPVGEPAPETTDDVEDADNKYQWYDLTQVPVGAVVYRITKRGALVAFQRLTDRLWLRVQLEPDDVHEPADIYTLVAGIESIESTHGGRITLLCDAELANQLRPPHASDPAPAQLQGDQQH